METINKKSDDTSFRAGFIALVGPPNAGKSTLLNRIIGKKVAIVSPRPQTTRNRITGVYHGEGFQIVFIDTPGIHRTRTALHKSMVSSAQDVFQEVDLVAVVVEWEKYDTPDVGIILSQLRQTRKSAVLVINKIDTGPRESLLPIMDSFNDRFFEAIVPISALTGDGVDVLLEEFKKRLKQGPPFFPEDMDTDQSETFLASEIIREQVFKRVKQELPYAVAVTVDGIEERAKGNKLFIQARIHVETPSQKRILIGKNAQMIKGIGKMARKALERMFGTRVYLDLIVRVEKNWSRDMRALRRLGY
jgi:GTP-binding protein Era